MPRLPFELYNGDCLDIMPRLPMRSVDLVLVDPPYGATQCAWDMVIPLEKMWQEIRRIVRRGATVVFTSSQPFTSFLITSKLDWFRYTWVWDKVNRATGFLDSQRRPLKSTEDIVVFCDRADTVYNPQFSQGKPYTVTRSGRGSENYGSQRPVKTINEGGKRFPQTLLSIPAGHNRGFHPTQKPVALMTYLIKTYSQPGDTVLDFAMGSGTTGVACGNLGRRFIGIEKDTEHGYFEIAQRRIREAYLESRHV